MALLSTQLFSDGVLSMVSLCQGDPRHFPCSSTCKGGLTTAIAASTPEEIISLQSSHGQTRAARACMHLHDPARAFDTYRAFSL